MAGQKRKTEEKEYEKRNETRKLSRVMIAAPKSGSGKTTITCALLQALKNEGWRVISYKCGPDYIDPMFHTKVIGVSSKNLDTFFTDEEETVKLFLRDRTEEDFAVLEGVMGLFDGLGGVREEGSSYHLAKVTKTPIVLVVDAKGMGRSVIPLIAGFLAYDSEGLIRGVILNRMSEAYYGTIRPLIEEELHVRVLGYFPENGQIRIESRHLGLKLPHELSDMKRQLQAAAEKLQTTVSVEEIVKIAEAAEKLAYDDVGTIRFYAKEAETPENSNAGGRVCRDSKSHPVIAVAWDEAFCFYYEDNLELLRECGAEIVYFSPLKDTGLPEKCSGLLLGGGYPELYAEQLSGNARMLESVNAAMKSGMPVVAECGGFMYLHTVMEDKEGKPYTMVGAVPGRCHYKGKLVRFGYVELTEEKGYFLPKGAKVKGHEFHYYDSTDNGRDCLATKPTSGRNYYCVISDENHWLGFPHIYYPSNPVFAMSFVKKAEKYSVEKAGKSEDGTG